MAGMIVLHCESLFIPETCGAIMLLRHLSFLFHKPFQNAYKVSNPECNLFQSKSSFVMTRLFLQFYSYLVLHSGGNACCRKVRAYSNEDDNNIKNTW